MSGLSISFQVDVPNLKVGSSLLFEHQRCGPPRGVWGPPENFEILMLFSAFSSHYLSLKNNQIYDYIYHVLCLTTHSFTQNLDGLNQKIFSIYNNYKWKRLED